MLSLKVPPGSIVHPNVKLTTWNIVHLKLHFVIPWKGP